jgi:DNA-binding response OmpR family regulator
MKGDREKFLDNDMDGYVTKPVDFGELARRVTNYCLQPSVVNTIKSKEYGHRCDRREQILIQRFWIVYSCITTGIHSTALFLI